MWFREASNVRTPGSYSSRSNLMLNNWERNRSSTTRVEAAPNSGAAPAAGTLGVPLAAGHTPAPVALVSHPAVSSAHSPTLTRTPLASASHSSQDSQTLVATTGSDQIQAIASSAQSEDLARPDAAQPFVSLSQFPQELPPAPQDLGNGNAAKPGEGAPDFVQNAYETTDKVLSEAQKAVTDAVDWTFHGANETAQLLVPKSLERKIQKGLDRAFQYVDAKALGARPSPHARSSNQTPRPHPKPEPKKAKSQPPDEIIKLLYKSRTKIQSFNQTKRQEHEKRVELRAAQASCWPFGRSEPTVVQFTETKDEQDAELVVRTVVVSGSTGWRGRTSVVHSQAPAPPTQAVETFEIEASGAPVHPPYAFEASCQRPLFDSAAHSEVIEGNFCPEQCPLNCLTLPQCSRRCYLMARACNSGGEQQACVKAARQRRRRLAALIEGASLIA
jgi:hypothetical protein